MPILQRCVRAEQREMALFSYELGLSRRTAMGLRKASRRGSDKAVCKGKPSSYNAN